MRACIVLLTLLRGINPTNLDYSTVNRVARLTRSGDGLSALDLGRAAGEDTSLSLTDLLGSIGNRGQGHIDLTAGEDGGIGLACRGDHLGNHAAGEGISLFLADPLGSIGNMVEAMKIRLETLVKEAKSTARASWNLWGHEAFHRGAGRAHRFAVESKRWTPTTLLMEDGNSHS